MNLPEFDGATTTTTKPYCEWRKGVEIAKNLDQLQDTELAAVIFSQVTRRAKSCIEVMEPEDLKQADALQTIYDSFDDAFEKMDHERLDQVYQEWERAHRGPSQPVVDWALDLRKKKLESQLQDPSSGYRALLWRTRCCAVPDSPTESAAKSSSTAAAATTPRGWAPPSRLPT